MAGPRLAGHSEPYQARHYAVTRSFPGRLYRSATRTFRVHAKWWRVPVGEVPRGTDHESQVQWLYDWWERIDAWITANRPENAQARALSPGPPAE